VRSSGLGKDQWGGAEGFSGNQKIKRKRSIRAAMEPGDKKGKSASERDEENEKTRNAKHEKGGEARAAEPRRTGGVEECRWRRGLETKDAVLYKMETLVK